MSSKKKPESETTSPCEKHLKGSSPINPPVPILNIPKPSSSASAKSPNQVGSSSNEASQNQHVDEPEVMVLDEDEEMDAEVNRFIQRELSKLSNHSLSGI